MTPEQRARRVSSFSGRPNPFGRNHKVTPLGKDEAERQGAISALAFQLLGGRDAALDFLNTEHATLSGRPIAVATRSAAGFARVEQELRARSLVQDASHG